MNILKTAAVIIILGILCCEPTKASQGQSGQYDSLLSDLRSSDSLKRAEAFYSIKDNQEALRQPIVRRALFALLNLENHDVETHGDEHGLYLSDVLGTLMEFVDWHDEGEVCILADSTYGVPSDFAKELATNAGTRAIPCLLKRSQQSGFDRSTAINELLQISQMTKDLPAATRKQINDLAIAGLRDQAPGIRLSVAMASQKFGTRELVPVLEDLAHSDPYTLPGSVPVYYSVREIAMEAIRSIQERAKAKTP